MEEDAIFSAQRVKGGVSAVPASRLVCTEELGRIQPQAFGQKPAKGCVLCGHTKAPGEIIGRLLVAV